MPIINQQRRLREVGRIRLGEQVPITKRDGTPGTAPKKINSFRFTSSDEQSINAVAALYGGEPKRWDGAPVGEQFELYTETNDIDVIVPPVDLAWSQWFELWSGGGCLRRCDGQTNVLNDSDCACDPDERECKTTTRLSVILVGIDGVGLFRLETHGYNAASELLGTVEILRTLQSRGQMVPARLRLEQRQSKRDGKTFNFAVPVLDLKVNVAAMLTGDVPAIASTPVAPQLTSVTPIARNDATAPSVAEQMQAVETPEPRKRNTRSAAQLPSTGVAPRTAAQAERTVGGASQPSMRRLFAILGGKGIKDDDERHKWASGVLGKTVTTFAELSQGDVIKLNDAAEGKTEIVPVDYEDGEEPF